MACTPNSQARENMADQNVSEPQFTRNESLDDCQTLISIRDTVETAEWRIRYEIFTTRTVTEFRVVEVVHLPTKKRFANPGDRVQVSRQSGLQAAVAVEAIARHLPDRFESLAEAVRMLMRKLENALVDAEGHLMQALFDVAEPVAKEKPHGSDEDAEITNLLDRRNLQA